METVRTTFLLNLLTPEGKPVFLTGGTGVGKSVIIQNYLRMTEGLVPIPLTFSA